MTSEELFEAKDLQGRLDAILNSFDGLAQTMQKIGMITESALLKLSEDRVDYIAHRVEQRILEAEPLTELEQQEHNWESNNDR